MTNQFDGLLMHMADKHLEDLRKEATHQRIINEVKGKRTGSNFRRQLGMNLIKMGQRLASPEVSTAA